MAEHHGHRREQLESTLKRAVQRVLAEGLNDPRADGAMLTVTGLRLGDDLKIATITVSVYPVDREKLAMHALRHAAAHVRHAASELVSLKQMPQMVFEVDQGLKAQGQVLDALARVAAEREARARAGGNNPPEASST